MLGRLRFHFPYLGRRRDITDHHRQYIFWILNLEHTDRFEKQNIFVLTHGPSNFYDGYISLSFFASLFDPANHFQRNMRNHLDTLSAILEISLPFNDFLINRARRQIIGSGEFETHKTLIVSHILISFVAICEHKHLSVFRRIHRPRIDIDIRIDFHRRHRKPTRLKDFSNRRGGDTLPHTAHHAAHDKNILLL